MAASPATVNRESIAFHVCDVVIPRPTERVLRGLLAADRRRRSKRGATREMADSLGNSPKDCFGRPAATEGGHTATAFRKSRRVWGGMPGYLWVSGRRLLEPAKAASVAS